MGWHDVTFGGANALFGQSCSAEQKSRTLCASTWKIYDQTAQLLKILHIYIYIHNISKQLLPDLLAVWLVGARVQISESWKRNFRG